MHHIRVKWFILYSRSYHGYGIYTRKIYNIQKSCNYIYYKELQEYYPVSSGFYSIKTGKVITSFGIYPIIE
jgi:hypothetical protein